ncbi:hypothetical protein NDU88_004091 [Pleurodeles waltl]|uniref:Secreted protein n=1 Tax=Pleurodeles waltl TaxID=8319 RepID=A0AAV7W5L8_PLEWA|nr:hypothetical protein NDU88_004091 [Pleurodeles waltl]
MVRVLLPQFLVPLLVWVLPPQLRVLLLVQVLPLQLRVLPSVWLALLVQELPSWFVLRPPFPLFPSSPGLRREGLYKAPRHPKVELYRFLPDSHPGHEQHPNWCPRDMAGATEMRSKDMAKSRATHTFLHSAMQILFKAFFYKKK